MGLPRAVLGFYSFMVLSSIGAGLILMALLRHLPTRILLPASLAVLLLHPLIGVSALPVPLRAVLYEPVRDGAFRSLYPIIPWSAIVLAGFVIGRDFVAHSRTSRWWFLLAGACLAMFLTFRLFGAYGNAHPYERVLSFEFWSFAKYPPDLPFLTWAFFATFLALGVLTSLTRGGTPALLKPFAVLGRVPFFFYVVHFYVLFVVFAIVGTKLSLGWTYLIWILLLPAMVWPCARYYDKKRHRPNFLTRYF
jgi:uncharacterized membrane protein